MSHWRDTGEAGTEDVCTYKNHALLKEATSPVYAGEKISASIERAVDSLGFSLPKVGSEREVGRPIIHVEFTHTERNQHETERDAARPNMGEQTKCLKGLLNGIIHDQIST